MSDYLRRWSPLLAVIVLLVVAWLASVFSSPQINNIPIPALQATQEQQTDDAREESSAEPTAVASENVTEVETPNERGAVIVLAGLTIVVAIASLVGWMVIRRRTGKAKKEEIVFVRKKNNKAMRRDHEIVAAVDAGMTHLSDTDADPRAAVIACWVRLEQVAAAVGTPRHVADSPTDLVTRLLRSHNVGQGTLDGLADVYREARYATHQINESRRRQAIEALRQVRVGLGHRPLVGARNDQRGRGEE